MDTTGTMRLRLPPPIPFPVVNGQWASGCRTKCFDEQDPKDRWEQPLDCGVKLPSSARKPGVGFLTADDTLDTVPTRKYRRHVGCGRRRSVPEYISAADRVLTQAPVNSNMTRVPAAPQIASYDGDVKFNGNIDGWASCSCGDPDANQVQVQGLVIAYGKRRLTSSFPRVPDVIGGLIMSAASGKV